MKILQFSFENDEARDVYKIEFTLFREGETFLPDLEFKPPYDDHSSTFFRWFEFTMNLEVPEGNSLLAENLWCKIFYSVIYRYIFLIDF